MGRFNALTPNQDLVLRTIVSLSRECQSEQLWYMGTNEDGVLVASTGSRGRRSVPVGRGVYQTLAAERYIDLIRDSDTPMFTVRRQAFDYVDYPNKRFKRFWKDFAWDLAHDDTIRSKLLWAAIAVLVAWGVERLSDLLRAP